MHYLILNYLVAWKPLGYALIFIGLFLLFTASFLTHQGVFDLGDMTIVAFLGTFMGDIFWYSLGYYVNGKFILLWKI